MNMSNRASCSMMTASLALLCLVGALWTSPASAFSPLSALHTFGRRGFTAQVRRTAPQVGLRMQQGGDVSDIMRRLREMEEAANGGAPAPAASSVHSAAPAAPSSPAGQTEDAASVLARMRAMETGGGYQAAPTPAPAAPAPAAPAPAAPAAPTASSQNEDAASVLARMNAMGGGSAPAPPSTPAPAAPAAPAAAASSQGEDAASVLARMNAMASGGGSAEVKPGVAASSAAPAAAVAAAPARSQSPGLKAQEDAGAVLARVEKVEGGSKVSMSAAAAVAPAAMAVASTSAHVNGHANGAHHANGDGGGSDGGDFDWFGSWNPFAFLADLDRPMSDRDMPKKVAEAAAKARARKEREERIAAAQRKDDELNGRILAIEDEQKKEAAKPPAAKAPAPKAKAAPAPKAKAPAPKAKARAETPLPQAPKQMTPAGGNPPSKEILEKEIEKKATAVSPADEIAGEVTGGTEYKVVPKKEVGFRWPWEKKMETEEEVYKRMVESKLSYNQLLLDRAGYVFKGGNAEFNYPVTEKKKIVVLGTGWGSHAFLKSIDADAYDVTVVSPRNYFVFTPMLAGAATGTVEMRSITESIRDTNPKVNYLEATAMEVLPDDKEIVCQTVVCEGQVCSIDEFKLPYDDLIVTVGASVNTFGIKGVKENCYFLKQINDADLLRKAIGNAFERANFPVMSDWERARTLSFVVVGAGPTGIEFTGELRDFIEKDVARFYPHLLPYISIKILEASDKVLMQFEESLQAQAIKDLTTPRSTTPAGLRKNYIEVMLKSSVKEVEEKLMTMNDGSSIPYGVAVWAAGIGPIPLTLDLVNKVDDLKDEEMARGRITVDRWLRAKGTPGVIALGDCSFVKDAPLPATAQVASQQGYYLGRMYNQGFDMSKDSFERAPTVPGPMYQEKHATPFQFLNLGILAYTGTGNALAQVEVGNGKIEQSGAIGWLAWRSVYLSKQVSSRNQFMVLFDWLKTSIFGRDLTRF